MVKERIPAAQYLRMSTDHQRYSLQNQAEAIALFADQNGYEIKETYTDGGRSGLTLRNRAGLQKLLADVKDAPAYRVILVYDVSRWGRFQDADEGAFHEFICKQAGVPVLYCAEQFANSAALGDVVLKAIKRMMAGEYSRELSDKVCKGQRRLSQLGYRQGGNAGYGLRRVAIDDQKNTITPLAFGQRKGFLHQRVTIVPGPIQEVEVVRRIFDLYTSEGLSPHRIACHLNDLGVTRERGQPWTSRCVHSMLKNEKYIGTNVYGRVSAKLNQREVANPREAWIRVENAFEGIVDKAVFEEAQRHLRAGWRRYSRVPGTSAVNPPSRAFHLWKVDQVTVPRNDDVSQTQTGEKDQAPFIVRRVLPDPRWIMHMWLGGVSYKKVFADADYGSTTQAWASAKDLWDRTRPLQQELAELQQHFMVRCNSTTGLPGISRVCLASRKTAHWTARWQDPATGTIIKRSYNEGKYGARRARRLAILARGSGIRATRLRYKRLKRAFILAHGLHAASADEAPQD